MNNRFENRKYKLISMDLLQENEISSIPILEGCIGGESIPSNCILNICLKEGRKEGKGILYSSKHIILAELNYHNDLLQGLCIFRNEKGRKIKECVFENDMKNGWIKEYGENDVLFTGIYRNNEKYSELVKYKYYNNIFEEIKDGKRIGIWKFTDNYHLEGICCMFEDDKMIQEYSYKNGCENHTNRIFMNDCMIEFDENDRVIYYGKYSGDYLKGFVRKGKGEVYHYDNDMIVRVDTTKGYILVNDKTMKQFEDNKMVYQGEWCWHENRIVRNGIGYICSSPTTYYQAVFDNGIEIGVLMNIRDEEMILYDEKYRIVYKGGYDDDHNKSGDGLIYEYEEDDLKIVFACKDGKKEYLWLELIDSTTMKEFDDNGKRIYEGGYNEIRLQREGKGDLYDGNQYLIYSGDGREGKREGKGCYYKNNLLVYEGEWKNDKPNGEGEYYNKDGEVILEGEWIDGVIEYQNEKKFYYEDGKNLR